MAESARRSKEAARVARREAALAARPAMTPPGPAPDHFRIATWNVNSLRVRMPAVERFLTRTRPDVVCLQETRGAEISDTAASQLADLGYQVVHVGTGGFNGVALLSRHSLMDIVGSGEFEAPALDREPRAISAVIDSPRPVRFVSVYVPHGRAIDHWHFEYKLEFLGALAERVRRWSTERHLVVAGDVNVAATDSDVFHPDAFVGATHVTPAERAALEEVLGNALVDVDVARWGPRARRFTWWKPGFGYSRNLGMRIDVIAADHELAGHLETTWIDHEERGGERPSDHAALLADFRLDRE